MGMFSLFDSLLDSPLAEILADLPIAEDVKDALRGEQTKLRDLHLLILAYEKGNWDTFAEYAAMFKLPEAYLDTLLWATNLFGRDNQPCKECRSSASKASVSP